MVHTQHRQELESCAPTNTHTVLHNALHAQLALSSYVTVVGFLEEQSRNQPAHCEHASKAVLQCLSIIVD